MMNKALLEQFGHIDIYLFDQLLKGRLNGLTRVLDLGCGAGRNLVYFLQQGYEVFGIDQDADQIDRVRALATNLCPGSDEQHFQVGEIDGLPFPAHSFDLVIANAVLHFARDASHFEAMIHEAWRVLRPGGIFFARLASNIGISDRIQHIGNGRFQLPDGTERYLVDQRMILNFTRDLDGELLDPVKTTIVQDMRSMTTWVVKKKKDPDLDNP